MGSLAGLFALVIGTAVAPAAPAAAATTTVCALTTGGQAVMRYNGTSWTQIGGPANRLYSGGFGLFATTPDRSQIARYLGSPWNWQVIGSGGVTWAVTNDAIYGLSPDSKAVYQWSGSNSWWVQVGGPAAFLWGGGFGMFATIPDSTGISRYLGTPFNWQFLGSFSAPPQIASAYAVTGNTIYALSQTQELNRWDLNRGWLSFPDAPDFVNVAGGGLGGFGITADNQMFRLVGGQRIAGPGTSFTPGHDMAVADNSLYAGSPLRDSIWKWSGTGSTWTKIGDFGFWQLVACP